LYWSAAARLSVSAAYRQEHFAVDGNVPPESFGVMDTRRLPIEINYFTPGRLRASARFTFVDQSGTFAREMGTDPPLFRDADSFWLLDLRLAYRLPNRRGSVSLGIDNALDERFRFQDTDPYNPSIAYERMLALRFNLTN